MNASWLLIINDLGGNGGDGGNGGNGGNGGK
jgi:hypothetical protein